MPHNVTLLFGAKIVSGISIQNKSTCSEFDGQNEQTIYRTYFVYMYLVVELVKLNLPYKGISHISY